MLFQQKNDHDGRRGNSVQSLTQWRHPWASSEAWDVLHWTMRTVLYSHILVIKIASGFPTFFVVVDYLFADNQVKDLVMVNIN